MNRIISKEWRPILQQLNSLIFDDEWRTPLPKEALSSGWCGSTAASESEVLLAEQRLGVKLPPSYRTFLLSANGWSPYNHFIERLPPAQDIDWLQRADPQVAELIIQCYPEDLVSEEQYRNYADDASAMRTMYYPQCLLIGRAWPNESEMILLNPQVVSLDQEWEAIFFANWLPGNVRYPSFREFVLRSIATFR